MNKIEKFGGLIAWQKARGFTKRTYEITRQGDLPKDFWLKDQIQQAAGSSMSNIAETLERGRHAEFHQFLSTAKASWAEVRFQLHVASDAVYLSKFTFDQLQSLVEEAGRILGGLRTSFQKWRGAQKPGPGSVL